MANVAVGRETSLTCLSVSGVGIVRRWCGVRSGCTNPELVRVPAGLRKPEDRQADEPDEIRITPGRPLGGRVVAIALDELDEPEVRVVEPEPTAGEQAEIAISV